MLGSECLPISTAEIDTIPLVAAQCKIADRPLSFRAWDEFAVRCGASYHSSFAGTRGTWLQNPFRSRLRRFGLYRADTGDKVGQVAVVLDNRNATIVDRLQLLPEQEELWRPAMAALLTKLGPGRYRYGSYWNLEPPREDELRSLENVRLEAVQPISVQAVDFARWPTWEDYFRQISNNARRNAVRAIRQRPALALSLRRGWATLLDLPVMTRLAVSVSDRKKLDNPPGSILLRLLVRGMAMRHYAISAVARDADRALASFSGIEFGLNTYYLNGGSEADNAGAAWYLMLEMLRRSYRRSSGSGKFLMGPVLETMPGWGNLARSREQCRAADFPTSVVTFSCLAASPIA
jgi:hypothetical protein